MSIGSFSNLANCFKSREDIKPSVPKQLKRQNKPKEPETIIFESRGATTFISEINHGLITRSPFDVGN